MPLTPCKQSARLELRRVWRIAVGAVRADYLIQHHYSKIGALPPPAVIAIGKAATASVAGVLRVTSMPLSSVFIAVPRGYEGTFLPQAPIADDFEVHVGGHPIPDFSSLRAGHALYRFCSRLPPNQPIVVLISGGGSACVEYLRPGVSLRQWYRAVGWAIENGWNIGMINRLRQRFSLLKGGGLRRWLGYRRVEALWLSDVAGDGFAAVASGPLSPPLAGKIPDLPVGFSLPPPPEPLPVPSVHATCLASNATAGEAAARVCNGQWLGQEFLSREVNDVAEDLARRATTMPPGVLVCGGEPTVTLPDPSGRGGRCQQLALLMAKRLSGRPGWHFLAGATDGHDGNSEAAGAIVDGATVARGFAAGLSIEHAISTADSGSYLGGLGDALAKQATGTNVRDLGLLLKTGD